MRAESPENASNATLYEAYELMGVTTMYDLSRAYTKEDQKLMKEGTWDYKNPDLLTNKIKILLEKVDPTTLSEEEKEWRGEILWFWYHHAISCALWRYKDKERAQECAEKALGYQDEDHPNKITRLFYFLLHDDLKAAEDLAEGIENDKETAQWLIDDYVTGKWFR
mgnify:CR=1 FL=1